MALMITGTTFNISSFMGLIAGSQVPWRRTTFCFPMLSSDSGVPNACRTARQ